MFENIRLLRELLTFILGILLVVYASANINISPPPQDLASAPRDTGKSYCIPMQAVENQDAVRRQMQNAYVLMVLSMVGGLYLLLSSFSGAFEALAATASGTSAQTCRLKQ